MNVGGQHKRASVPKIGASLGDLPLLVSDQLPAGEVPEQRLPVAFKHYDIDVTVVARQPPEPRVNCPSAAQRPRRTVRRHELSNASDRFRDEGHRIAAKKLRVSTRRTSVFRSTGTL